MDPRRRRRGPDLSESTTARRCTTGLLAFVFLPLHPGTIKPGLDSSWFVALSLARVQSLDHGRDLLFTYGPWGVLAVPQDFYARGQVLALVYATATAIALFSALLKASSRWLPLPAATAATAAFGVLSTGVGAPELGLVALAVTALGLVPPIGPAEPLPRHVPVLLGALAALQLQVKFGVGLGVVVITAVVVLSRAGRRPAAVAAAGTFFGTTVVLWLLAGQHLGDLPAWFRGSLRITAGYNEAMAVHPTATADRFAWVILLATGVALAAWVVAQLLEERRSAVPLALLLAWSWWYLAKQGFVRLEYGHRIIGLTGIAALALALPWRGWWRPVGAATAAIGLANSLLVPGVPWSAQLGQLLGAQEGASSAVDAIRLAIDDDFQKARLAEERAAVLAAYGFPADAIDHLEGDVFADPYDVSLVWALQREWRPVPAFQTYFAYTPALDDANAEAFAGPDAPDIVLQVPGSIDARHPLWEAPEHRLAILCNYDVDDPVGPWQVLLHRSTGRCGDPEPLSEVTVEPGELLVVPRPHERDALVVAEFDYPVSIVERLAILAAKALAPETAVVDGARLRLVTALLGQRHLLHVPATVDGEPVPHGGADIHTIRFDDADGPVHVRFLEIPLSP